MNCSSFFLLCSLSLLLFGCHSKPKQPTHPPVGVTAFTVEAKTIPAKFTFVGVARSSHPVDIYARVEGYLLSIDYLEGSMVKKDDLLFHLDPSPYLDTLAETKGELAREEANLWRAKRDLQRLEPLYEQKAASQKDRDNALSQVLSSEAAVLAAQASVKKAELNVSYTYVKSPIEGLSNRAAYREGTLITPNVNGLLTQISVINPIWVLFPVSDSELLQSKAEGKSDHLILPEQQNYSVELKLADGSLFPYKGNVNFASPTLDPETGSLTVRAQFDNPQGEILPGQFVQAIVSGAYRPNAIYVPQESVFQGNKGNYVFVINEDNTVTARQVQLGAWYENYWIINEGLKSGERVVFEGTNKVQNGSTVQIIKSLSDTKPLAWVQGYNDF
jgi:membrane fusion protein (multidrug efflux system)